MNKGTDTWIAGYDWIFAGENHYSIQIFFPTTPKMSAATKAIRSPSTMSSVTCSTGKTKFSSSLSGSPTSFGYWQISVASYGEKHIRIVWHYRIPSMERPKKEWAAIKRITVHQKSCQSISVTLVDKVLIQVYVKLFILIIKGDRTQIISKTWYLQQFYFEMKNLLYVVT